MATNVMNMEGSVLALLQKIVEVSGTSREQLKNQEETAKLQGDMLIQHGEILKQHGELLKNQGTALGLLANTIEKQYATIDLQVESHAFYLQESQKKGFKILQKQIDAIRAACTTNNAGTQPNDCDEVPEAGGRCMTRGKFTLGLRKEAIKTIKHIKAKKRVGTRQAMKKLLKLEKFAGVNMANLNVWWGQQKKVLKYLRKYPDHVDKYRMSSKLAHRRH